VQKLIARNNEIQTFLEFSFNLGWEFFLRAIFRHASEAFWVEIARKQKF
jgi:hypothetical protein